MRVTTWAEYGLIVSVHLARRSGDAPVPARELAAREHLPADYVEQILLRLRRAQVVKSVRGAKGGYLLAQPASALTAKDVIEGAEEHTFEVQCDVRPINQERCEPNGTCAIRPLWRALQGRIDDFLGSVTLADLAAEESRVAELVSISGARSD
ncbi:MAG TPA: Rrf2 family transcriptional regulator [Gemmatimonadales bacterium]